MIQARVEKAVECGCVGFLQESKSNVWRLRWESERKEEQWFILDGRTVVVNTEGLDFRKEVMHLLRAVHV